MDQFGTTLRRLRRTRLGKQLNLASNVGCSEAAISLWETGTRLPSASSLRRITEQLQKSGASVEELEELNVSYLSAVVSRVTAKVG